MTARGSPPKDGKRQSYRDKQKGPERCHPQPIGKSDLLPTQPGSRQYKRGSYADDPDDIVAGQITISIPSKAG